jgi:DNA-binding response OmpR family regulator
VLLITGLGVRSRTQEILDLGADGVLEKPFTLETLTREMTRILES